MDDPRRAAAIQFRQQGLTVPDIAARLGVARSTAYVWTRHLPVDPAVAAERRHRHLERMREARWGPHRQRRAAARAAATDAEAQWVGPLSRRELRLLGAIAYWCEGAKEKPWRRDGGRVQFINSDEVLIQLLLRFLEAEGVDRRQLGYRLSIHESADVEAATRAWAEVVGVPPESFRKPTLKRHNARTVRRNVGAGYRGCLIIDVPRSSPLYWRIEGLMSGIAREVGLPASR